MKDSRWVEVKGVATHYFEAGAGEPLILVHGGQYGTLYNARDWDQNFHRLADSFHVYAVDKLGMGRTDNPLDDEGYVIGATVQHLIDFTTTLGLDQVHLAGHSRGGYAVARLALEQPARVKTITIVASGTLMRPPNPIYDRWQAEANAMADPRDRVRYLKSVSSYSDAHITESFIDYLLEIRALPKTRVAAAKMRDGLLTAFKEDLIRRQLETQQWIADGGLQCPVHVIWGYNDPSATLGECGVPTMELVFPVVAQAEMSILNQAAHYCFRDQPEAFQDRLTSFIGRH
jgi:pimeloyl-ACP methyl ester carboxylesterase